MKYRLWEGEVQIKIMKLLNVDMEKIRKNKADIMKYAEILIRLKQTIIIFNMILKEKGNWTGHVMRRKIILSA